MTTSILSLLLLISFWIGFAVKAFIDFYLSKKHRITSQIKNENYDKKPTSKSHDGKIHFTEVDKLIEEKFYLLNPNIKCSFCQNNQFTIVQKFSGIYLSPKYPTTLFPGSIMPCCNLVCKKCGMVTSFNLLAMGILKIENDEIIINQSKNKLKLIDNT